MHLNAQSAVKKSKIDLNKKSYFKVFIRNLR